MLAADAILAQVVLAGCLAVAAGDQVAATRDNLPLTNAAVELRHWVKCIESTLVDINNVQTADGHTDRARSRLGELHALRHELTRHLHALLEENVEARQVLRFPLF